MKRLLVLLFVVLSTIVYCNEPYFTEENVNTFIEHLESEGFILQGTFYSFDMPDLFSNYTTTSCYGNNADTPCCVYCLPRLHLKQPRTPSLSLSDLGKMKLSSI